MSLTREEALAALGLDAAREADAAAIQRAFERLARRYPQPNFPDRFHQLMEARDALLDAGRVWREELTSRTLDLAWLLPYLAPAPPTAPPGRTSVQDMLCAGYLAEPIEFEAPFEAIERLLGSEP